MEKDFKAWSEDEKDWRGREDARTLARAEAIKADKNRYNNAKDKAKEMAIDGINEVRGMSKVAGIKVSSALADSKGNSYPNPATLKSLI